ncbi:hypothetical protein A7Q09_02725 [Methylacidiphilum sp. Yel]|uniref:hypothetical protein n=1 Tax=Methylacidiphilum sp. Yel TaxID=1847730 RepID=UPI00106BB8EE|nr:hypothetical protein [Methylacidiphilum sp. Yel]TFE65503.1 hypothetical protein A7Q09_02725 [Methylacidiphilum sp. Yel]
MKPESPTIQELFLILGKEEELHNNFTSIECDVLNNSIQGLNRGTLHIRDVNKEIASKLPLQVQGMLVYMHFKSRLPLPPPQCREKTEFICSNIPSHTKDTWSCLVEKAIEEESSCKHNSMVFQPSPSQPEKDLSIQELSNELKRIWEEKNQGKREIQDVDKLSPEIQNQILLKYLKNKLPPDKYKEGAKKVIKYIQKYFKHYKIDHSRRWLFSVAWVKSLIEDYPACMAQLASSEFPTSSP